MSDFHKDNYFSWVVSRGYAVPPLHIIINYVSRVPLPAPATMTDDRYHHKTESRLITGNLSSAMFLLLIIHLK
jgi:hypothetical protein